MANISSLTSDELILFLARRYIRRFRSEENVEGSQIGRTFEKNFYEVIRKNPKLHLISTAGNLGMGHELMSTSGIRHEIDCVVSDDETLYVFELKHYFEGEITKEMLTVFNHKVLDFYFELIRRGRPCKIKRVFVTRSQRLANFTREFAMSWGIGLVDNEIPPPVLLHRLMLDWSEKFGNATIGQEWWNIANDLVKVSMRGFDEIFVPFSRVQVSLNADVLLGPDESHRLVENHFSLWNHLKRLRNYLKRLAEQNAVS